MQAVKLDAHLVLTWNTGRTYTPQGQRIAVWDCVSPSGMPFLLMHDYDRGITYMLQHRECNTARDLREYVMQCYDSHFNTISFAEPGLYNATRGVVGDHPVATMKF